MFAPWQVTPTSKHNLDGYELVWMMLDVRRELDMQTKWYQWWGKNFQSIKSACETWAVAMKHILRPSSYKGNLDSSSLPGLKYDCATSLGVLVVCGVLCQIRGLASPVQCKIVKLLRAMVSKTSWPSGLSLLPDLVLDVEDGCVSLNALWERLRGTNGKAIMKTRRTVVPKAFAVLLICCLTIKYDCLCSHPFL